MRTRGEARSLLAGRITMRKIVCFHNPDESNGYLSNWFLSEFYVGDILYSSMEQYMMYQKARLFQDTEIADKILHTSNVGTIKMLGRSVKDYQEVMWNGMRQIIVYRGLLEKFQQNDGEGRIYWDFL